MQRFAIWKMLTVGALFSGLGIAGAGAAVADSGPSATQPPAAPAAQH